MAGQGQPREIITAARAGDLASMTLEQAAAKQGCPIGAVSQRYAIKNNPVTFLPDASG